MQDIGRTVSAHKQWVQPLAKKYPDLRLSAPAVTNGKKSANGTAMGVDYLKGFLQGCKDCKIDFVVAHWYDKANNVQYFKNHMKEVFEASGRKPLWITEFGVTEGDAVAFLKQVLPWMDQQEWIWRYAYQWAAKGVMVNAAGNGLTSLGHTFATF